MEYRGFSIIFENLMLKYFDFIYNCVNSFGTFSILMTYNLKAIHASIDSKEKSHYLLYIPLLIMFFIGLLQQIVRNI